MLPNHRLGHVRIVERVCRVPRFERVRPQLFVWRGGKARPRLRRSEVAVSTGSRPDSSRTDVLSLKSAEIYAVVRQRRSLSVCVKRRALPLAPRFVLIAAAKRAYTPYDIRLAQNHRRRALLF